MLKLLVGLCGLLEALYPERVLAVLTDLSYEYDGETPTAKPWVVTAARIEGVILLGVALRAAIKADCAKNPDSDSTNDTEPSRTVDRI